MRKTHLYTLLCVLCFPSLVCAQQAVFDEFRKAAGDYAALYSGKAEENYNQQKYLNHPYWNTDEFREGAVCYGRWLYSYNPQIQFSPKSETKRPKIELPHKTKRSENHKRTTPKMQPEKGCIFSIYK